MNTAAERNLLKRAQQFDERALAEIYDRWSPAIYRYALRLLGDVDLAEECVSETFSRFLTALKNGNGLKDYLQAYLYRIAHNWITDYYRRRPPLTLPLDPEMHADPGQEPHRMVDQNLEKEQVRAALTYLTPEQRQVIVLKFLEGWETKAIARSLNRPTGAVKALQHRALETLRHIILPREEASL